MFCGDFPSLYDDTLYNTLNTEANLKIQLYSITRGGSCLGTHVRIKDFKIKKMKNKIKNKNHTEKNKIKK